MGELSHRELVALGWTLLHFLWQGAFIAVAYSACNGLTLRARAALRYSIALGAFALMPLSVCVTFALEMHASRTHSVWIEKLQGSRAHSFEGVFRDTALSRVPTSLVTIGTQDGSTPFMAGAESLLPWVDAIWVLGVVLLATRAFGGWLRLQRIHRKARGILPAEVQRSFERIKRQLAISQQVLLCVSEQVISPFAMGLWRATVVLPVSAMLRLPPEELEAVFAHELAHIRRFDYLCNLGQIAIESALFFHPAVWWLSRTVRDRREICCDEIAVATCADAIVYASALLHLEEQRTTQLELAVAFKGRSGMLLQRIQQVLGEETTMANGMNNGVRIVVAGAIVAGLLLAPKISSAVAASHVAETQVSHSKAPEAVALPAQAQHRKPAPLVVETTPSKQPDASEVSTLVPNPEPGPKANPFVSDPSPSAEDKPSGKGLSYMDGMRAAGYALDLNNDLNTLISLKSLGVTPEYAKAMGDTSLGKPTVHELISLKSLGVTPEYLSGLMHSGLAPKNFQEVVSERALGITPEYAAQMKQSGFGDLNLQALISLKAQGITPEYATWLRKEYPQATVNELRRAAVFHLDKAFVDKAQAHGIDGKDLDKLIRLKISGLLDE